MLEIWVFNSTSLVFTECLFLTYTDPEAQEKLRRSMSGEDNSDKNYTTSEAPSSTRDTGFGVDPNNSRDLSGSNTGSATHGSSNQTFRAQDSPIHGSTTSHGNTHTSSHTSGAGTAAGAAGAAVAGTATLASSNANPSSRDTGYGVDPSQSREIGGNTESSGHSNTGSTTFRSGAHIANPQSSTTHSSGMQSNTGSNTGSTSHNTQSANIPVSASAPVGSGSHTGSGIPPTGTSHLNTGSKYDGSTRTPSNTISSHQAGAAGAAIGGTAASAGSGVPSTTRDTGYGVDPDQSREIGDSTNTRTGASNTTGTSHSGTSDTQTGTTYNTHTTTRGTTDTTAGHTSPSDEINKAAHDHGAAGAAGAALGLAVGGTSGNDSSIPPTTRDTGHGVDSENNSAPGFNTMTPNSKLANPDGTSRDFSGNNNNSTSSEKRDISDNASTRAIASSSNKDLPSTGDSTHNANPEEELVDVDGPGPRPVADVAADHGGDAGKAASDEASTTSGNKSGGLAGEHGTDDPKHDEVKAEGTGEKWVKTSGLAADGGDFDATKPGAGREADRKSLSLTHVNSQTLTG